MLRVTSLPISDRSGSTGQKRLKLLTKKRKKIDSLAYRNLYYLY